MSLVLLRRPHSEAKGKQNNSGYYEDILIENIEVLTEYGRELEKFKHFTFHASRKGTCSISSKGRNTQGTWLRPRIFLH